MKRAFLITIDTEGDRMWSRPASIQTENARYLHRFQQLCERFGFKPTYLTNYEMAESREFQEFGRDLVRRGAGEVGMHLHAWNSPPLVSLTGRDMHYQPYLIEYPPEVVESKVEFMTRLLEDRFNVPIVSHRSGRWALDATYVRLLIKYGYRVDCSVTPTVSWSRHLGNPAGSGGSDYTDYPAQAYFVDPVDPARIGGSQLLELPMTIDFSYPAPAILRRTALARLPLLRGVLLRRSWLRPQVGNLKQMLKLVRRKVQAGAHYIEFMLHSSEFMPGGSPTFSTAESIERMYDDLVQLFELISPHFSGSTLAEYGAGVDDGTYPALRVDRPA
ncbi:MAG: deacetylase [Steroidobacteraceae bacterium]